MSLLQLLFSKKTDPRVTRLESDEFLEAISKKKTQLLDVRTGQEFKSGHLRNAINLNFFDQGTFRKGLEKLNKQADVYVYCRSGNRSKSAAELMAKMGFEKIYDLKRGYSSL